jgi:hypothetical protein
MKGGNMSTAIGDLVATVGANTAPFQSAMSAAGQTVTRFAVNVQSAAGGPIGTLVAKLGDILNPFNALRGVVNGLVSPFSSLLDTVKEAIGQVFNLVNPVNWLGKALNGLVYPLQWCAREFEKLFDVGAAFENFAEDEAILVRMQSVLKATGNAVGVTIERMEEMTGGHADKMGAMIAMVSTKKISGAIFEDAYRLSRDLAAVMGTDLQAATSMMATALANPERAVKMLRAAHISLTQAEQDAIKGFVKMGDTASAQAIILGAVQNAVGGTASALSDTLGGQMKAFKKELEELSGKFGKALAPIMREMIGMFKSIAEWLASNEELFVSWGLKASEAFKTVTEPIRNFFNLLKTDSGAAFVYLQLQWSRTVDRIGDGVTILRRLFVGIGKILMDVFQNLGIYLDAKLEAMVARIKSSFTGVDDQKYIDLQNGLADQALFAMKRTITRAGKSEAFSAASLLAGTGQDSDRTKALRDQSASATADAALKSAFGRAGEWLGKALPTAWKAPLAGMWEKAGFKDVGKLWDKLVASFGGAQAATAQRAKDALASAPDIAKKEKEKEEKAKSEVSVTQPAASERGSQAAWETIYDAMTAGAREDYQKAIAASSKEAVQVLNRIADKDEPEEADLI